MLIITRHAQAIIIGALLGLTLAANISNPPSADWGVFQDMR